MIDHLHLWKEKSELSKQKFVSENCLLISSSPAIREPISRQHYTKRESNQTKPKHHIEALDLESPLIRTNRISLGLDICLRRRPCFSETNRGNSALWLVSRIHVRLFRHERTSHWSISAGAVKVYLLQFFWSQGNGKSRVIYSTRTKANERRSLKDGLTPSRCFSSNRDPLLPLAHVFSLPSFVPVPRDWLTSFN